MTNENINRIEQAVTTLLSLIKGGVWGEKTVVTEKSVWQTDWYGYLRTPTRNGGRLAASLSRLGADFDGNTFYPEGFDREFVNVWERAQRNPQSVRTDGHRAGVTVREMDITQYYPQGITLRNSGEAIFSGDLESELKILFKRPGLITRYESKIYLRRFRKSWVNLDLRYLKGSVRINRSSNITNLMGVG